MTKLLTLPETSSRSCSNNRGDERCRGTVTHAVIGYWVALDACTRCVREWYSKDNGPRNRVVIVPTPFTGQVR